MSRRARCRGTDVSVVGDLRRKPRPAPGVGRNLSNRGMVYHHIVFALKGGTLLGLHGHPGNPTRDRFDELQVGLDHVAFACVDRAELEEWARRLDVLGIAHAPVVDASYGSGLSFRDPDNIALEFFAPPTSAPQTG